MFSILTHEISIDKKDLICGFLKTLDTENSELTFTNLFIWRKSYNVRYIILFDTLVIISKHQDSPYTIYFPIGDGNRENALSEVIQFFEKEDKEFQIRIYDEKDIEKIEKLFPGKFRVEEDTDSFDYVYKISDLANLAGKKYHSKRNFINRFENRYDYVYEKMTPRDKDECLKLFKKWYSEKDSRIYGLEESFAAVTELLDNWENLDITGGCIRVSGKMVAFSFGEPLNSNNHTVVIHLEHADTSFDGAFPMMNRQFLLSAWQDYSFVNREEDMGLEGLRKAKQSYYPCRMAKKYYARKK